MFFSKDCQTKTLKIRNLVRRRKRGSLLIESLGAPDTKVFFFSFCSLYLGYLLKMLAKYLQSPIIYVKCYANTSFLLLILTIIVMVMILLWSRWFQVTIVTKMFILNFSFPEARFVPSFIKSSSSIGVPWAPWAVCACSCVPVGGGHEQWMRTWLCECCVAFTCLVQLQVTELFVQKRSLKGWWSIWLVVWVFTPAFCH